MKSDNDIAGWVEKGANPRTEGELDPSTSPSYEDEGTDLRTEGPQPNRQLEVTRELETCRERARGYM